MGKPKPQKIAENAIKKAGGRRIGIHKFSGRKAVKQLKAEEKKKGKANGP